MKKKWLWIGLGVLVVLLLVGLNFGRRQRGRVVAVQMVKVRREDITSVVKAPGKIEPLTQVKISADLPGKIVRLAVHEGDRAKKGDLLVQLDDTQYRASLQQARAALASARARLAQEKSSFGALEGIHRRQESLFNQHLLSQQEWDQAHANYLSQRSSLQAAREEVQRAEGMVTAAQDNVNKCRFVSPITGIVSALNVEEGEIVVVGTMNNPGTQVLTVSDLSAMLVRADVDETDVPEMKLGQKAKITVDALPDTSYAGRVTEIGNTAKRTNVATEGQTNFEVKVLFDQSPVEVRPGMTADVEIATSTHANTNGVPIQAVVVRTERELRQAERKKGRRAPGAQAATAEEDTVGRKPKEITGLFVVREGIARFVPVRTGIASETDIEVFGALQRGDAVVSGPYKALRDLKPGTKVRPEKGGEKAKK